ncbi:MAG: DUF2066 domain-containing protein [Proteobacteria bacterium]|nr:DUF2066 domain-containing protein [Pseudomonadota bacterium]
MKVFLSSFLMILLFYALSFSPLMVQAVVVTGLYEAEVPVLDQSASSRKKNMAAVLRVVLIKLTGDRQVPSRNGVTELLLNADQYVQQFEYRTRDEAGKQQLTLWAQFNRSSLDKILHEAAIPEWGRERPSTLVWLAVGDARGRRLTGLSDISGYVEKMEAQAKTRGIVLIHPLLDLQDTGKLQASDIWGGFQEPVLAASGRYHADVILTGRIESVLPELWEAHWIAYIDDQAYTWITQGTASETVLDEGIDGLADVLAERYGQAGTYTRSDEIEILVNDITDYNQYSKVLNYLESLNSVTNVEVKEVKLGSVVYLLTTRADIFVISKAVDLGHTLEQISAMSYRLVE